MPVSMRFQLSWLDSSVCYIFPAIMKILIHYISLSFMDIMILCISLSWRFWYIYIVRGDDHTCHILYHVHCNLMYVGLLYVFAVICRDWLLYYTNGWLVLPPGSSSLHFSDRFIMYFGHQVTPLTSHIRGHLLQLILPHMVEYTFMAFPVPLQTLEPMDQYCTFDVYKIIPKNTYQFVVRNF